ncbi:type II toxin-antitoxin system YafQ family toxin [Pelotomaculum schinkii]|uniref:type II toxin-antitoxin system YafQ family toxin n=1 Tax=Pelotomaculum schinkii TaxID=78350 RepID=UPI00167ED4B1|nr:type II toxin-antitoxin system YafQ family toxin [Pelotomaculum schinkii]
MLTLKTTAQFRKDYKLAKKRGYKMDLLEEILQMLLEEKPLDKKHLDHALTGNYIGFRECHILSDWLLIYEINESLLILTATRTGTHSDLFKK